MAALTAAREASHKPGDVLAYKLKGAVTAYKGALVMLNNAGYALPAADAASSVFAGVAYETKANPGADGTASVKLYKSGDFEFDATGADQSWVGLAACVVDDHTVALASATTNDLVCGYVSAVLSSTRVRVRIDRAAA